MKNFTLLIAALLAFPYLGWADALDDEIYEWVIGPCYRDLGLDHLLKRSEARYARVLVEDGPDYVAKLLEAVRSSDLEADPYGYYEAARQVCRRELGELITEK